MTQSVSIFRPKVAWGSAPVKFGTGQAPPSGFHNACGCSKFSGVDGFNNADAAKQELKAAGCIKPLFAFGGRKTQEYEECAKNYQADKLATQREQAKADVAAAAAAPAVAAAADANAKAEAEKTARSLTPFQIGGLIFVGLITTGVIVLIGVKVAHTRKH